MVERTYRRMMQVKFLPEVALVGKKRTMTMQRTQA